VAVLSTATAEDLGSVPGQIEALVPQQRRDPPGHGRTEVTEGAMPIDGQRERQRVDEVAECDALEPAPAPGQWRPDDHVGLSGQRRKHDCVRGQEDGVRPLPGQGTGPQRGDQIGRQPPLLVAPGQGAVGPAPVLERLVSEPVHVGQHPPELGDRALVRAPIDEGDRIIAQLVRQLVPGTGAGVQLGRHPP
jgi:hypothetical protein